MGLCLCLERLVVANDGGLGPSNWLGQHLRWGRPQAFAPRVRVAGRHLGPMVSIARDGHDADEPIPVGADCWEHRSRSREPRHDVAPACSVEFGDGPVGTHRTDRCAWRSISHPVTVTSAPTSPAVWRISQLIWQDLRTIVQGLVSLTDWCSASRTWTQALHERPRKRQLQCDSAGLG